jgi:HK97 family phage major capsid protein
LDGYGTTEPLGVITGTTQNAVAASPTAITINDITNMIGAVDLSYQDPNDFKLMFNQTVLTKLKQLTTSTGYPIWQPGSIAESIPNTIFGTPYVVNNNMASNTAGQKAMLCGNFRRGYVLRDIVGLSLHRLDQLYMASGDVGFCAISRHDGGVRDAKAFAYLQMAAS